MVNMLSATRRWVATGLSRIADAIDSAVSFEGARFKSSDAGFRPPRSGPNAELETPGSFGGSSAESIAAAVGYELNNNELLDGGVEAHIDAVVRTGITLVEPDTRDEELNAKIRELWEMATARADVARLKSLGEQQALAIREIMRAGEIFPRIVWAPSITVGGVPVPAGPAIELVPSERVPRSLSGIVPEDLEGAGNKVRGGIELTADGQVAAVWVLKDHPDDASPFAPSAAYAGGVGFGQFGSKAIERVPVKDITPVFWSRRAAQIRGVSPLCSALNTVRQLRSFVDASTTTATLAARMGVIMSVPNQAAFANNPNALMVDAAGNPATSMRNGAQFLFVAGEGGGPKHVGTIQSNTIGASFEGFITSMTRFVSRALRRTASQLSGDYAQNNFAGARMAQLDNSKSDERWQALVWSITAPYYRAVINTGLSRGQITVSAELARTWADSPMGFERLYAVGVTAPGQGYANPEQEARANASDIAVGIKSRIEACQERGVRYTDVIEESLKYEQHWNRRRQELGLPPKELDGADKVATAAPTQGNPQEPQQPQQPQRAQPAQLRVVGVVGGGAS